jgi:hypothetical protein
VVRRVVASREFVLFTDTHLRYLLLARLRDSDRLGAFGEISAGYLLTEPQPGTTRLLRRMRLQCGPRLFRAFAVPVVVIWGEAITARHFLRGAKRRAEAAAGASSRDRRHPRVEPIRTRIEHEFDTRSTRLAVALLRLTRGRIAQPWHRHVLILTTTGRRSGKPRTVPLQYFPAVWVSGAAGAASIVPSGRRTGIR